MFKTKIINLPDYTQNGLLAFCKFRAFNCPWEIHIESRDHKHIKALVGTIVEEIWRIESKYRLADDNNIMARINRGTAESVIVDDETASLLDFADICYLLSDGKFDVTCHALHSNGVETHEVENHKKLTGWHKIRWDNPRLRLLQGMKLNLNSYIKAHACDKSMAKAEEITSVPLLISYSNNVLVNKNRTHNTKWLTNKPGTTQLIPINNKALAIKSSTFENIYDALSCEVINNSPELILVEAESITEANMLAMLAKLSGKDAEGFLSGQEATYQIQY